MLGNEWHELSDTKLLSECENISSNKTIVFSQCCVNNILLRLKCISLTAWKYLLLLLLRYQRPRSAETENKTSRRMHCYLCRVSAGDKQWLIHQRALTTIISPYTKCSKWNNYMLKTISNYCLKCHRDAHLLFISNIENL